MHQKKGQSKKFLDGRLSFSIGNGNYNAHHHFLIRIRIFFTIATSLDAYKFYGHLIWQEKF